VIDKSRAHKRLTPRAALVYAIKRIVFPATSSKASLAFDSQVERLMNQYHHLSAFPENRHVLSDLKARGIPTGILSNGDAAMLQLAVKSAALPLAWRRNKSSLSAAIPGMRWRPPGSASRPCG
jgi:hypothetical protein